jgi:hypothetical protein
MKSTKRPNHEALELFDARHDESDFNIVIELNEAEMNQVAGGYCITPDPITSTKRHY